jgi:hypothetical protein
LRMSACCCAAWPTRGCWNCDTLAATSRLWRAATRHS